MENTFHCIRPYCTKKMVRKWRTSVLARNLRVDFGFITRMCSPSSNMIVTRMTPEMVTTEFWFCDTLGLAKLSPGSNFHTHPISCTHSQSSKIQNHMIPSRSDSFVCLSWKNCSSTRNPLLIDRASSPIISYREIEFNPVTAVYEDSNAYDCMNVE